MIAILQLMSTNEQEVYDIVIMNTHTVTVT